MSAAGHVSKETIWTLGLRVLIFAGIGYPIYFLLWWNWVDSLKASKPLLAILLTALPALLVYGAMGWNHVSSESAKKQTAARVQRYRDEIEAGLKAKDYGLAFDIFFNELRSSDRHLLENSRPGFNFRALVEESLGRERASEDLVDHLLRYALSSISGTTQVHWAYLDPYDPIEPTNMSLEILHLLNTWKVNGLSFLSLPRARQWVWDHIELYLTPYKEGSAHDVMRSENPLLAEIIEAFGYPESQAIIEKHPKELLNRRGRVFGTPVHALLLQEELNPYEKNRMRIRLLHEKGARLHSSEETSANLGLLKIILESQ
jgi:hypothetical protein